MTEEQWSQLLAVIDGESVDPLPVGFIVDCPWLPGWAGMSATDYFASEEKWFEAHLKAARRFPDVSFLPGFWAEYGMCTEPSAFGAKCSWFDKEMPSAARLPYDMAGLAKLARPNAATDGMAPFVLKRLEHCRGRIEEEGHAIRFAVARGPLNVASFLMGPTELLTELLMSPDEVHALLSTITDYLVDWIQLQARAFDSIGGILLLDDIVGFVGDDHYEEFAEPYLKRAFEAADVPVRFFHNDAKGLVCAPRLSRIGINLFNFSHNHSLKDMREWVGPEVALLGNLPPRDVLAQGTPDEVGAGVEAMLAELDAMGDRSRVVLSCGGGMPPGVTDANIEAFIDAAQTAS